MLDIFTESEFERFSGQEVNLSEGQVLLFDPVDTFPEGETLNIDDKTFEIVHSDYVMPDASTMAQIYEQYYLVFQNEAVVEALLAPSVTYVEPSFSFDFDVVGGDPESIVAIKDALMDDLFYDRPKSVGHFSCMIEDSVSSRQDFMNLYGGLFFLGLFLGVLFLLGTALIIYYKQVSEGYDDARRFNIMQKVGMSHKEVKQSIHSQILLVFFLPLVMAVAPPGLRLPHAGENPAGDGPGQHPADFALHLGLRGRVRPGVPHHLRPYRPHLLQHCGDRRLKRQDRKGIWLCFPPSLTF